MPAYVATDGPPAIDATHAWAPATGTAPPTINDQNSTVPPTLPWIKLLRPPTGWRALPEADDFRAPRTAADGEIVYPGRKLGKTLVYECEVRALTLQSLGAQMTALTNGFGDMSGEGTMTVTPFTVPGGVVWTFTARVLSLEPDDELEVFDDREWKFAQGFQLNLRMSSPYFTTGAVPYL